MNSKSAGKVGVWDGRRVPTWCGDDCPGMMTHGYQRLLHLMDSKAQESCGLKMGGTCPPGAVMTARGKRGTKGLVVATAHSDMLMKYWHLHGQKHKRQQQ